jgi:hypothetical protein
VQTRQTPPNEPQALSHACATRRVVDSIATVE